jgi:hypothetical protein
MGNAATPEGMNGAVHKRKSTASPAAVVLLAALHPKGVTREQVDALALLSNGPELIRRLRRNFDLTKTELYCTRRAFQDSRGRWHYPGTYYVAEIARPKVLAILAEMEGAE